MEACLDSKFVPGCFGVADDGKSLRGREMHYVTAEGGEFLLQIDDSRNGIDLESFWT
jgi:hypothetical protein